MIKVEKMSDKEIKITLPENMHVGKEQPDVTELYHALTNQLVPVPNRADDHDVCIIQVGH
ncbi:hypothetical protein [Paenibacillus polymyxa]|uniref:hypothetical protein n=1 Tax=Paenibacillus polymyxa TaxID=1406 RepID=UPI000400D4CE|nr:hypothetical protein [Paenibacillus polymyxa]